MNSQRTNVQFFMPTTTNCDGEGQMQDSHMRVLESKHRFLIPDSLFDEYALNGMTSLQEKSLTHMCLEKLKFRYKPEAVRRAMKLKEKLHDDRHFGVYKCKLCNGWHFTHRVLEDDINVKHGSRRARYRKMKSLEFRSHMRDLHIISEVEVVC